MIDNAEEIRKPKMNKRLRIETIKLNCTHMHESYGHDGFGSTTLALSGNQVWSEICNQNG
jgi:hypothetical protein